MKTENCIWLSDVLDEDMFFKGTLNIVVSPCGSGKTEAAISILASTASQPNKALYLIDTTSGCQRVENDKENRMKAPCHFYSEDIESNYFDSEFDKEKIVVTTYAKFGSWCSRYPDFADHFEIIACDEVHNLVQYSTFNNKDDDGVNYTAIAKNSICAAVKRGKTLFFGITATPEYLDSWTCPQYYVPIDTSQLKHYEEKETVYYASIHQLLKSISPSQRGALYVTRVTQMVECEKIAKKCGHSPICLWSPAYEKRRMNDEQMRVRNHLLQYANGRFQRPAGSQYPASQGHNWRPTGRLKTKKDHGIIIVLLTVSEDRATQRCDPSAGTGVSGKGDADSITLFPSSAQA